MRAHEMCRARGESVVLVARVRTKDGALTREPERKTERLRGSQSEKRSAYALRSARSRTNLSSYECWSERTGILYSVFLRQKQNFYRRSNAVSCMCNGSSRAKPGIVVSGVFAMKSLDWRRVRIPNIKDLERGAYEFR